MLVLSRRAEESIEFPNLGITIQVLRISPSRAHIGVKAPREVTVVRGELEAEKKSLMMERFPTIEAPVFQSHLHQAAEVLQRLSMTVEQGNWQESEPLIYSLFAELKAMDDQVRHKRPTAPIQSANKDFPHKKKALLVDDNENETKLLASYLKLKDIDVITAFDGNQALNYLDQHETPDVVVLDMNMPKFDGPWTVRELRSKPRYTDIQIYAVSGMDRSDYQMELGPNGVNRWFQKPLNPEELISQISSGIADLSPIA